MVFFEVAKDSDVREAESRPAAQCKPNGGPVRIARLLAWGTGYGKEAPPQFRKPESYNTVAWGTSF